MDTVFPGSLIIEDADYHKPRRLDVEDPLISKPKTGSTGSRMRGHGGEPLVGSLAFASLGEDSNRNPAARTQEGRE